MRTTKTRPLLSIQSDWDNVLPYSGKELWISAKVRQHPSVEGKIKRTASINKGSAPENFQTTENFQIDKVIGNQGVVVSYENTKTFFLAPSQIFKKIHDKDVVAIDTTDKSKHIAVSASDKCFKVWDSKSNGNALLEYSGHVSDINKVYFFPSGVVLVSCSLDMQIKIVCADTGSNPRTLIGHTRSVTDIAIVSRGRNIISVSKDCRALLWNVGESKIISQLLKTDFPILCCDLTSTSLSLPKQESVSDLEIDTEDKLLLIGCEGGDVFVVAVESRKIVHHTKLEADVKCARFCDPNSFALGLSNGKTIRFKIKQTSPQGITVSPVSFSHFTDSCVLCVLPYKEFGFFSGHHDGHCVFHFYNDESRQVHLTGPLFDPVFDICYDGTCVYTASRDGNIRKYAFEKVFDENVFGH